MKPKNAPTSPKTEAEHKEFEKFYAEGLQTIDQPRRIPLGLTLVVAFLVGILGAVGTLAGVTELSTRLPGAAWLHWFIPTVSTSTVVVDRSQGRTPSDLDSEAQRQAAIAPVVIGIYKDIPGEIKSVADLPAPNHFRGAGVVVSSSGLLLTTKTVVPEPAEGYSVLFSDHRLVGVDELHFDPASPFVFLTVKADNLRSAKFVSEDAVRVGTAAMAYGAIGIPDRLTVANGTVSAFDVRIGDNASVLVESSDTIDRLLAVTQRELPSGTPLFTVDGEVIGLALREIQSYGQLVIPSWHMRAALRQLLRGPDLVRPLLGVQTMELGRYPVFSDQAPEAAPTGALITTDNPTDRPAVRPKSPAAQARLKPGDSILQVNDTPINQANPLSEVIQDMSAGDTVTILYRRDGKDEHVKIKLGVQRP